MALEQELTTFKRELSALLQKPGARGKFALVHADQIEELFSSEEVALAAGYERFGLKPFLVKEVTDDERPMYFSRNIAPCRF